MILSPHSLSSLFLENPKIFQSCDVGGIKSTQSPYQNRGSHSPDPHNQRLTMEVVGSRKFKILQEENIFLPSYNKHVTLVKAAI